MNLTIKIISTFIFFYLLTINISLVKTNDYYRANIALNLSNLEALAQSGSESCFGDSYPLERQNVASGLCWCNDQSIYSQTCTGSGIGCTEIQCDDN